MTKCYEMARELGNEILMSEEYARLKTSTAVFNASEAAKEKLASYYELRQNGENYNNGELEKMAEQLSCDLEIGPMIDAQNDFNTLVNTTMEILRQTITEQMPGYAQSCGSGCESCGGCN